MLHFSSKSNDKKVNKRVKTKVDQQNLTLSNCKVINCNIYRITNQYVTYTIV